MNKSDPRKTLSYTELKKQGHKDIENHPIKILLDVDGVLLNLDGSYTPYVKHLVPDFSEEKYIVEWNMPQVEKAFPEAFNIIKSLWSNPEFMGNVPLFPTTLEALKILAQLEQDKQVKVLIHTAMTTSEVGRARVDQFDKIFSEINHEFEINIHFGLNKKSYDNFDIIIEDSLKNLNNSRVPHKVMIEAGNNRFVTSRDIKDYTSFTKKKTLLEYLNSNEFKRVLNKD